MSISLSPENITLPMKLDISYDVQKIVFTGPLAEIVTGTLTELTDDMLPPDLTVIRDNLFQNNELLTTVELNNIVQIGASSFSECAITDLSMPALVNAGMQAFSYNPFTSITLPSLTEISTQMFQGCENLTTADFDAVTIIDRRAFYNCYNLETLILRENSVVELDGTQHFYNTKIENGTGYIYVPNDLVNSYRIDEKWVAYGNQICSINELEVE